MKDINSETEFESHIRNLISERIIKTNSDFHILKNKKAVDMIICSEHNDTPVYFL